MLFSNEPQPLFQRRIPTNPTLYRPTVVYQTSHVSVSVKYGETLTFKL